MMNVGQNKGSSMGAVEMELEQQGIFENAGQAVHVAFLIMAQEATQDAPLRKALIRAMESVQLGAGQRHWLDQLRGSGGGTVNFEGLSGPDIRAQCALITQAVKTKLPNVEMWVLQAMYGQTDYEDVADEDGTAMEALEQAKAEVRAARDRLTVANVELAAAGSRRAAVAFPGVAAAEKVSPHSRYDGARAAVRDAEAEVIAAESRLQSAQVVVDQKSACKLLNNGPLLQAVAGRSRRRYAFSAERINAIKGLSDWFAPMFPRIKPLAIDLMLGRMFANHKKIDISVRDLAAQFGGSHMTYFRASWKMKNHIRKLEELAMARLEPIFREHGVTIPLEDFRD